MKTVKDFYDVQWESSQKVQEYNLFLTAFSSAIQHSYFLLGDIQGKKILEIGCGSGEQARHLASSGAKVIAIDISMESVKQLSREISKNKVKNIKVKLMNAEKLAFPDNNFDAIYINSVLMHVHQERVFQQCLRILKSGGRLVILEPLKGNPLLALVRRFLKYRSMNPQYMSLKKFKWYRHLFRGYRHKEFYLLSWCCFPLYAWVKNKEKVFFLQNMVEKLEQGFLQALPFLRSWCWVSVAVYRK